MQLLTPNEGVWCPFRSLSLQFPAWLFHFHYLIQAASELFDAVALSHCRHVETRFSMLVTCTVPKQQGRVSAELPCSPLEVI